MSDEKLDLILSVVSDIKNRQQGLEITVGEMNLKIDNLSGRVDNLSGRVDSLSSEFFDFKKQVADSFAAVQKRFAVLEKQMFAIGVEIKEEIKTEIKTVAENIDRLEQEILFARASAVENRVKVRELETRLTKIENHIGLTV